MTEELKEEILHNLKGCAQKMNGALQLIKGLQNDLDKIWESIENDNDQKKLHKSNDTNDKKSIRGET